MHRHGYKGRKFGRERDQRSALMKGLAGALIDNGSIETTLPKARSLVPYTEKLITRAKKGDLHSRRQVIDSLSTLASAHKLFDDVAPKLTNRTSGHLRIEKTTSRRGDNTMMAKVSFVDDLTAKPKVVAKPVTTKSVPKAKPAVKKTTAKAKKAGAK